MNNCDIVHLDVGGKIFKTSRSLLEKYKESVLATLVSDKQDIVFIDRSGDIFTHVLDYLRYGSISLPVTVSKDMFLRDLDFYGIVPEDDTVKTYSEGWASRVSNRRQNITSLQLEQNIDLLANFCANQHLRHEIVANCPSIDLPKQLAG